MEIKKLIKKALASSCIYFTVITALYMLILQIANIGDDAAAVEAHRVLLFFIASVLFALAGVLLGAKKLHLALRIVLHYAICVFAFYTCFILPTNMQASFVMTGIVLFTLLYVIVALIAAAFISKLRKNRESSTEYNKQFKKQK